MPGTCLEGIRVDSGLPGFSRFAAILAVRNNRAFRTTVSRDRLEQDDEYLRVANICADMLCDYIAAEAARIQNAEGHPLSQASTATRWLYSSLQGAVGLRQTAEKVIDRQQLIPQVVVEAQVGSGGDYRTSRELTSLEQVSRTPVFWTMEARVVDYLGVISRDLGRELSFTEFLAGIAPELHDPNITPVISDAHHYKDSFLATHEPEVVRYSKRHQQTAAKWVLRTRPEQIVKPLSKAKIRA
jgi:hypothetical protein